MSLYDFIYDMSMLACVVSVIIALAYGKIEEKSSYGLLVALAILQSIAQNRGHNKTSLIERNNQPSKDNETKKEEGK